MKINASYNSVLKLATPIMVGMLTQNIMQITNTAFLGRVGEVALGVSAVGGLFYMLLTVIAFGISMGAQILIARRMGEGKEHEVGPILHHTLLVLSVYTVIAFLILQYVAPIILPRMIHNPSTCAYSISFLKIRSYGVMLSIFTSCFNAFYTGVARTKVIMYSTLFATVINIILDYILIYGHFGMPALNTDGAAISSIIAEFAGLVVLVYNIYMNNYKQTMQVFVSKKFDMDILKKVVSLGSPLMVQYLFSFAAWYLFFILIEHKGPHPLAISNILRSILFLLTISCWAIGGSVNSLVSNLIGQNEQGQVKLMIKKGVIISASISFVMVVLMLLFNKYVVSVYTTEAQIISDSFYPSIVMGLGIIVLSIATVIFQGVQGTGATKMNLITELIAVSIYSAYLFLFVKKYDLSLTWAWGAELVYWISILLISFSYLYSEKWIKHKL